MAQGRSPFLVANIDKGKIGELKAVPRFPGAALCWKLICATKMDKTRADIARWSFYFASKRRRGVAQTYRKREVPTNLDIIEENELEEKRTPQSSEAQAPNIIADRVVLNPPNYLNHDAARIIPQKRDRDELQHMPTGPSGLDWSNPPVLDTDRLQKKLHTEDGATQTAFTHLWEAYERRQNSYIYWRDLARKRKLEEEDAQRERDEEERIKRIAHLKAQPFANIYVPSARRQMPLQAPARSHAQAPGPRLPPSHMTLRSGRIVVTNAGHIRRWKCAFCCKTAACTRHRVYWKDNYEMMDLCLTCEHRMKRGEILNYVADAARDDDSVNAISSSTNTDTSSNSGSADSDVVMFDVIDVDAQGNAGDRQPAAAGGVDVQVQVDANAVHADDALVVVVPNVQLGVQQPVAAAPVVGYRDMFWTNNPLGQMVQRAFNLDFSAIFSAFVFREPNPPDRPQQPQQPQQPQRQPAPHAVIPGSFPTTRPIAKPRRRRAEPPRQARDSQAARGQHIANVQPGRSRRAQPSRRAPAMGPNDPRFFFGYLA
ncbi:hypothetical protein HMPREF1624_01851 [Sporothrix schenckii ATCC 58251]|uniref:Uncharacterized protein n=1 Tax=Sporothrix schenckii (strain ATCC 58251 / de Perez 2211183) TaxID=1391915 RepID=U7PY89_SPOS1|nr:hypothetical protein HMPREF1624_01851 [Sporothrix schenckii ATCC 58251]